ncbi:TonB-linked outer membrane protein, SusC/RagA family [Mariniphaga anaerophila]|uniref:TonB-linked outer membrane protein, SusC/RagA family n=1 Tax=Mariniphaga anaerophila TaxID=1484053 RepID=A0A1M4V9E4_9BACT|nr:TonB-dependent receptor [Mariniphaga anaerophila]SHE65589.1 TonB-linked outer membrane protein, SusC/RagA family [Mariniphaga anaerophila]
MRLTVFLVLVSVFGALANKGYSQSKKLNLNMHEATIKEVLNSIEEQSEFYFLYSENLIDITRKVSVTVENKEIERVLNLLFEDTDVDYSIRDRIIVLTTSKVRNGETKVFQQRKTISGTVTDKAGLPLPGVTVLITGTTNGTVTNVDGEYSLSGISEGTTLQFSFVGMRTQDIKVDERSTINVTMEIDAIGIEEVVAIGYGTQKKADLTGAVETVSVSDMKSRPLTNASLALQGKVAGAFITQNSGQPGSDDATILIRGVGTFGNSAPLIIIDGMEGELNDVNPKDIASVSILKDAASSAIYGNRAANGVILIQTTKGKSDKMEVSYTGYYGVQSVTTMPDLLKGVDYLELKAEAYYNTNGSYPDFYLNEEYMNNYRNKVDPQRYPTDQTWADVLFQPADIIDNHVTLTGGNNQFQYSASIGYLTQDGIIVGNETEKLSMRINLSSKYLNDKLKVDLFASGHEQSTEDMVNGMNSSLYYVYLGAPTTPLKIPGYGYTGNGYNFAASEAGGYLNTKTTPINLRLSASLNLLKGLSLTGSYGINQRKTKIERFAPAVQLYQYGESGEVEAYYSTSPTGLRINNNESISKQFTSRLNYNQKIFNGFTMNAMVAMEAREFHLDRMQVSRENYTLKLPVLDNGDPDSQKNSGTADEISWLSYFSRLNLNYKNRYLAGATVRRDGSSRFQEKWGTFPSVSFGWRISEENFLKGKVNWLDNLKLRFSWGQLGNESINQYYAAYDELSLALVTNFGNTLQQAAAITKLANKKTSWETSEQINYGLDFAVLNNVLSGSIEYYEKKNFDILTQIPISSTLGLTTIPFQNVGEMENKGVEFQLNVAKKLGKVNFNANLSASRTTNKITDLGGQDEIVSGNIISRVGSPYRSFYAYATEGIYQSQNEIDSHLKFTDEDGNSINPYIGLTPKPGDIRFVDQNGDKIINEADKTIIGQSYPDWTFSSTFNFEWKNFDASLFFQGVTGINYLNRFFVTVPFVSGNANTGAWYKDAWREDKPSETIQRLNVDLTRSETDSEYYLEDGSYLRLKNIEVGYSLPKRMVSDIGIAQLRVFVNAQNALTWTKMRYGFDPEKPSATTTTLQYPQTRIISAGVNLKF